VLCDGFKDYISYPAKLCTLNPSAVCHRTQ